MLEKADIDAIISAVKSGAPVPGGPEVEADVEKDLGLIEEAIKPFFAMVAQALEEIDERLKAVESEFGGFTSGLSGIITTRKKNALMGTLHEKYPEFGDFQEIIKTLSDVDVWDEIGNDLFEYSQGPEYSEEGLDAKAKELLEQVKGKFGPLVEALKKSKEPKEEPAGEKPVAAVEVEMKSDVDPKLQKYLKTAK